MALDLSLSGFIGAGGGLAYALVALLWAASRGGGRRRVLFAGLIGSQGIFYMIQSLTTPERTGPAGLADLIGVPIMIGASLTTATFAAGLAFLLARETSRRSVQIVSAAYVILAIMGVSFVAQGGITPGKGDPAAMPAVVRLVYVLMLLAYGACAVALLAMALHWKAHGTRATPWLAAAAMLVPIWGLAIGASRSTPEALLAIFGLVCILSWAPPWQQGDPRVGRNVLVGLLAWGLLTEAFPLMPLVGNLSGEAVAPFEVVAALTLAIVVLKHRAWDVQPPRFAEQRGALAAAALASLFIVAQIAEQFLTAEYGILMGGVVAGALLFAASPIQRAMERLAAPSAASARTSPASTSSAAAYRAAIRAALRDGALTRREELHLAEVAEHLGLGAREAARLRHEVEDEQEATS